jgi:hypothetical protein
MMRAAIAETQAFDREQDDQEARERGPAPLAAEQLQRTPPGRVDTRD